MKKLLFVLLLIAAAVPCQAADFDFGVRAGVYLDGSDPFVGVEAITPLTRSLRFNPNVEIIDSENDTVIGVNGDLVYDFIVDRSKFIFAGGGVGVLFGDDTDLGVNILGGIGMRHGSFTPYAQAKVVIGDDNDVAVAAGIRF